MCKREKGRKERERVFVWEREREREREREDINHIMNECSKLPQIIRMIEEGDPMGTMPATKIWP